MIKLQLSKGLNVPIKGAPVEILDDLPKPKTVAVSFDPFHAVTFRLLVKEGDRVKTGQPIAKVKKTEGKFFVATGSGIVKEIIRGNKRRLLNVVIELDDQEEHEVIEPLGLDVSDKKVIRDYLMANGLFPHIRQRPFDTIASAHAEPRDIFIKGWELAPFRPSTNLIVKGHEEDLQAGISTLAKLTTGKVYLSVNSDQASNALLSAKECELIDVKGPYPATNHSVVIHHIAPVLSGEDIVWTLNMHDVITIGHHVRTGRYLTDKMIAIGGEGVISERRGITRGRVGHPLSEMIANRTQAQDLRFISGDPMTGSDVGANGYLNFYDHTISVLPEMTHREFLHFFRLGGSKYSFSKSYLSGHTTSPQEGFSFTTSLHGEERSFVDSSQYEKVMPMTIPTMHLMKAIIGKDYDLAEELGLLEVTAEDFALATFVCPSKIEMCHLVDQGLKDYSKEMFG